MSVISRNVSIIHADSSSYLCTRRQRHKGTDFVKFLNEVKMKYKSNVVVQCRKNDVRLRRAS